MDGGWRSSQARATTGPTARRRHPAPTSWRAMRGARSRHRRAAGRGRSRHRCCLRHGPQSALRLPGRSRGCPRPRRRHSVRGRRSHRGAPRFAGRRRSHDQLCGTEARPSSRTRPGTVRRSGDRRHRPRHERRDDRPRRRVRRGRLATRSGRHGAQVARRHPHHRRVVHDDRRSSSRCPLGPAPGGGLRADGDPGRDGVDDPVEAVGYSLPASAWGAAAVADLDRVAAVLVGPGLGPGHDVDVATVLGVDRPLVLDGDALQPEFLDDSRSRCANCVDPARR